MWEPHFELWNSPNQVFLQNITLTDWQPTAGSLKTEFNSVGEGSIKIPFDHPVVTSGWLRLRLVVRVYEIHSVTAVKRIVGAFKINKIEGTPVSNGEEAGFEYTVSGKGLLGAWGDAIVLPWLPIDQKPVSTVRMFNFASPDLPVTGWSTTVYAQDRNLAVFFSGRALPVGWPSGYSQWIWTRPYTNNMPPGRCFFRRHFTLAAETQVTFFCSADDWFRLWVDGTSVLESPASGDNMAWWHTQRVTITLSAGDHVVGVDARCAPAPPNLSIAGLILEAWESDDTGLVTPILATGTNSSNPVIGVWYNQDYPATPPGYTPGRIMSRLLAEAQGRGALPDMTLDFSDTTDSGGAAWTQIPEFQANVGDSLLQVVDALSASYVDVEASSEGLELKMWNKYTMGSDTPVTLTAGDNLLSYKTVWEG